MGVQIRDGLGASSSESCQKMGYCGRALQPANIIPKPKKTSIRYVYVCCTHACPYMAIMTASSITPVMSNNFALQMG